MYNREYAALSPSVSDRRGLMASVICTHTFSRACHVVHACVLQRYAAHYAILCWRTTRTRKVFDRDRWTAVKRILNAHNRRVRHQWKFDKRASHEKAAGRLSSDFQVYRTEYARVIFSLIARPIFRIVNGEVYVQLIFESLSLSLSPFMLLISHRHSVFESFF